MAAHFLVAHLGAQIDQDCGGEIHERNDGGRVDRIDQQPEVAKREPRSGDGDADPKDADQTARQRPDARQRRDQRQAYRYRENELGALCPVRPGQIDALQDLIDQLGMNFDSWHVGGERGRLHVVDDAVGRGADQHDLVLDQRRIEIAGKDIRRRDVAARVVRREIEPDPAGRVDWDNQVADLQGIETGVLAEAGLAVGAGGLAEIGAHPWARADAENLGNQRGDGLVAETHHQRRAADDLVPIDGAVEKAVAGGGFLQLGQIGDRRRVGLDKAQRLVAGERIAGLGNRLAGLALVREDEARDRRYGLDRRRQLRVGIGKGDERSCSVSGLTGPRCLSASSSSFGDVRSGSEKTMSKATIEAPAARSLSMSSASRLRGQGHCPYCFRLPLSMSTIRTGLSTEARGAIR